MLVPLLVAALLAFYFMSPTPGVIAYPNFAAIDMPVGYEAQNEPSFAPIAEPKKPQPTEHELIQWGEKLAKPDRLLSVNEMVEFQGLKKDIQLEILGEASQSLAKLMAEGALDCETMKAKVMEQAIAAIPLWGNALTSQVLQALRKGDPVLSSLLSMLRSVEQKCVQSTSMPYKEQDILKVLYFMDAAQKLWMGADKDTRPWYTGEKYDREVLQKYYREIIQASDNGDLIEVFRIMDGVLSLCHNYHAHSVKHIYEPFKEYWKSPLLWEMPDIYYRRN